MIFKLKCEDNVKITEKPRDSSSKSEEERLVSRMRRPLSEPPVCLNRRSGSLEAHRY